MEKIRFYEPIPDRYVRYINSLIPNESVSSLTNNIITKKCMELVKDFDALGFNERLLYFLFYKIVGSYYDLDKISYDDAYRYIEEATVTEEFVKRIKEYTPQSDFFIVFKRLYDDIDKLQTLLYENKSYPALKQYRDILIRISEDCVDKTQSEKEIAEDLQHRLPIPYNNIKNYQRRMKNKTYIEKVNPKEYPFSVVKSPGYSLGCHMIQNYLIDLMIKYYKKTGYYYHPIDDNLEYFVLNNISVITYKYDDTFMPYLEVGNHKLTYEDYEFWAIVLSPDFKINKLKHKIDHIYEISTRNEVILTPYDYMEESIIKYANGDTYDGMTDSLFAQELLDKIGMPKDTPVTDKLISDGNLYFKNPHNFEEIIVKDIEEYPTLVKLRSYQNEEERNKYIKALIAKYKGEQTKKQKRAESLKKEISQKKFSRKKANETYHD